MPGAVLTWLLCSKVVHSVTLGYAKRLELEVSQSRAQAESTSFFLWKGTVNNGHVLSIGLFVKHQGLQTRGYQSC